MNRALRRDVAACAFASTAEWALWVVLLVDAYERSGAAAAGLVSLGMLAAAAVAVPFAGTRADGERPDRALFAAYVVQSAGFSAAALAAALAAPVVVVLAPGAVVAMAVTLVRPCCAVVIPDHATSPQQLTAANLAIGVVDSVAGFSGPLLAAGLLAWRGPAPALLACAVLTAAAGASSAHGLRARTPASITARGAPARRPHAVRALFDAIVAFGQVEGGREMLASVGARYVVVGALDLLVVALAVSVLDLGVAGPGLLSGAVGVGAIIGSLAVRRLVGRRRLAPVIVASGLITVAALAVLGSSRHVGMALGLLALVGAATSVSDVTARMLIQRAAPQSSLASVFAVVEMLGLAFGAVGSILVQLTVAAAGARAATPVVAALVLVILAMTARRLRRIDDAADAPVVAIRLLRTSTIFGPLPPVALEAVARAAEPCTALAGEIVVREGETGDRYFIVADGEVEVTMRGRHVRTLSRRDGFGEIALLADVPRTATVTAIGRVELLAVRRTPFLLAVTGHDGSRDAAWFVAERWAGHGLRRDGGRQTVDEGLSTPEP